jgi:4-hydroxybenzoate polyprenyltransferase
MLKLILSRIRYSEAFIFQSPTILGLAMYLPGISLQHAINALLACLGSFLLAASILTINDWADINLDSQNSLKRNDTFLELGINPKQILGLSISLATAGTLVFAALSISHVIVALIAIVFGLAYSIPVHGMQGKSIPIYSSFLHFSGTLLAFLLGALTFAHIDWRSLLMASYPAVLITAGHLVQEVEDYEEDQRSQCRTNAVRFGQKAVFIFASLLFGFSFLLLYWLAEKGLFIGVIKYAVILYLLYLALAVQAYRTGLTRDSVRQLRNQYRILFAVIALTMMIGSLLKRWTF